MGVEDRCAGIMKEYLICEWLAQPFILFNLKKNINKSLSHITFVYSTFYNEILKQLIYLQRGMVCFLEHWLAMGRSNIMNVIFHECQWLYCLEE